MSKTNGFVKRFTLDIPQKEWTRIKQLKKEKNKNYKEIILEAVNVLFEKEQIEGGVSI